MSDKTCGTRCKEHDMPCIIAYAPKDLMGVRGAFEIRDASMPHIHWHLIPTEDGALLTHGWNNGKSTYSYAPKGSHSLDPITQKEAEELMKLEEGEQ